MFVGEVSGSPTEFEDFDDEGCLVDSMNVSFLVAGEEMKILDVQ
jgi:hypothetical protein